MKKFILTLVLCLFVGNARAEKSFDVDMLYDSCAKPKYSADWEFCLGFIRGTTETFYSQKPFSYRKRCKVRNFQEIIDRFSVMYKRNMFEIGAEAYTSVIQAITNLCELNKEEADIIFKCMMLDPVFNDILEQENKTNE